MGSPRTHALNYAAKCCRSCLWSDSKKRRGGKVTDRGERVFFSARGGKKGTNEAPGPDPRFCLLRGRVFFCYYFFCSEACYLFDTSGRRRNRKKGTPRLPPLPMVSTEIYSIRVLFDIVYWPIMCVVAPYPALALFLLVFVRFRVTFAGGWRVVRSVIYGC